MSRLFPMEMMQHSTYTWLPKVKVRTQLLYTTVLIAVMLAVAALPFIKVDVAVKATGLVRPVAEKHELRNLVAGTIDSVLATDGQKVQKGQEILRLQEAVSNSRLQQNSWELEQRNKYIHDLEILTAGGSSGLQSPLYRQQYQLYQAALKEQLATVNKLKADMAMYEKLFAEKVIAKKEFADRQYEYIKSQAAYQSTIQQQRSAWQEALSHLREESSRLHADTRQLQQEKEWNIIKAPVSGTLQQFTGVYAGGYIQAGALLGIISPDSNLVAECYISPKDIGYLKTGMPVRFQVDAFNYNEWGIAKGKVLSIDNDFTLVENQPVFKVKCSFAGTELHTRNGVKGRLKKGMTFQARFILTKRSLFQLLYDKADDWINPARSAI
jgi:HlyD family secretion protein